MRLAAVILAAGASRRLGRAKQLEPVEGEALICRAARAALAAGFSPVFAVLGARAGSVEEALSGLEVTVVPNPAWEEGMASSIRVGLQAVPPPCEGAALLVCDQVALTPALLVRLREAFEAAPERPAACTYEGVLGVPALFPRSAFPALAGLRGDTGARPILRGGPATAIPWPEGARDFDLDTP